MSTLDDLLTEAKRTPDDQISSLRFEVADGQLRGTVIARRTLPGLVVVAAGPERLDVDGLARLMFVGAMLGYVDRYAGVWRPAVACAITLFPVILAPEISTRVADEWPAWARVLLAVGALVVSFIVMVNSWQWTFGSDPARSRPR